MAISARGQWARGESRLSPRQETILKIIVGEYVSSATPVGSEAIARRHRLGLSPATIRHEMADLEEEGYITHPHTSAGRIPADKGYRYYVESLLEAVELPLEEQRMIRHQFHQVEMELEQWTRLGAAILAQAMHNAALASLPKARESRLKHIELVALQEFLALLIMVLQEAKLKQQMIPLAEAASQEELAAVANKLSATYSGLSRSQIQARGRDLTPVEAQVTQALVKVMEAEDEQAFEDIYLDGLRLILGQPEFATSERMRAMVEILEDKRRLKALLPQVLTGEGIQVVIGRENPQDAMRHLSLVITRYGIPGEAHGVLGILGPTRMHYGRAISMVRFMATVMSELVDELGR